MSNRQTVFSVAEPHRDQPVLTVAPDEPARGAIVLLHGRYASADSMLPLARALKASDWLLAAPQALHGTWYPQSFLAPIQENEPHLSSAIQKVDAVVGEVEAQGVEPSRIVLLGFSQGACLALEFAARTGRTLGGVVGLSGGLIGPPGTRFSYTHRKGGLHVFLGCSDDDPHIPVARVQETQKVFEELGSTVSATIYPGAGHTVLADELSEARALLRAVAA